MGVYTARALSYAGVEYDILEHALTPRQIADFDAYADAWATIHRNLEAALGASGVVDPLEGKTLNGQALSAAHSRFESSKQRFFGQLLLSMKLPSLLPAIEDTLATDHSVVIQLVSTAEALLDRRLADLSAEDRAEIQLDLSPREIVADYLDNALGDLSAACAKGSVPMAIEQLTAAIAAARPKRREGIQVRAPLLA